MTIPMSTWQNIRPEIIRKKQMMDRQIALLRQQQLRQQQEQSKYYGDNLKGGD